MISNPETLGVLFVWRERLSSVVASLETLATKHTHLLSAATKFGSVAEGGVGIPNCFKSEFMSGFAPPKGLASIRSVGKAKMGAPNRMRFTLQVAMQLKLDSHRVNAPFALLPSKCTCPYNLRLGRNHALHATVCKIRPNPARPRPLTRARSY